MAHRPPQEERFWAKVDRTGGPDACWLWTGYVRSSGKGDVCFDGKMHMLPNRVAYILAVGPIPDGMCICHHCDTPLCCNPKHLFCGTHTDNMRDKVLKGRGRPPRGSAHGMHKLTEAQVLYIRSEMAIGVKGTRERLRREFGICFSEIHLIVRRKIWKHI